MEFHFLREISGFRGILFVKRNSDFISNSNFNPSTVLPHLYISLGAAPPMHPHAKFALKSNPSHHLSSTIIVISLSSLPPFS
jgi:hypothetical protein